MLPRKAIYQIPDPISHLQCQPVYVPYNLNPITQPVKQLTLPWLLTYLVLTWAIIRSTGLPYPSRYALVSFYSTPITCHRDLQSLSIMLHSLATYGSSSSFLCLPFLVFWQTGYTSLISANHHPSACGTYQNRCLQTLVTLQSSSYFQTMTLQHPLCFKTAMILQHTIYFQIAVTLQCFCCFQIAGILHHPYRF